MIVARMRLNSISLMMCDTSIGAARRNTPRFRGLEEVDERRIGRLEQERQVIAQLGGAARDRRGVLVDLRAGFFGAGPLPHRFVEAVERGDQAEAVVEHVAEPAGPDAQPLFESAALAWRAVCSAPKNVSE